MSKTSLKFKNVSKSFFGIPAVRDVSFSLEKGRAICLIGENGAGKTTLMNILGGVLSPDSGTIEIAGEAFRPLAPADATAAGIAFIHQELNLFTNLSIAENIFIDKFPRGLAWLPFINKRRIRQRTAKILEQIGLSLSPDTKIELLSPGERQLVEIGKALSADARIIILDEPTSSLTQRETERLFDLLFRLREEGRSLIYISHVLSDVMRLADDIVVLRDGSVADSGKRDDFTMDRMISKMVGPNLDQLYPDRVPNETGEVVLDVSGLSQPGIVKDVDLTLHRGEVVGLFGLMGSGRTEFARILFGLDPYQSGRIAIGGETVGQGGPRDRIARGMAFVTEDRRDEGLLMDSSIAENLSLVSLPAYARRPFMSVDRDAMLGSAKTIGAALRIKTGDPALGQAVRSLSGGNQQKTVIGKWIANRPRVLIMDEPTRGIDVGAKYEVYTIMNDLAGEGTCILYISSELEELIGVCDRILVMHNGEVVQSFGHADFDQETIVSAAFGRVAA